MCVGNGGNYGNLGIVFSVSYGAAERLSGTTPTGFRKNLLCIHGDGGVPLIRDQEVTAEHLRMLALFRNYFLRMGCEAAKCRIAKMLMIHCLHAQLRLASRSRFGC
jgi:hypothetical protein